MKHFLVFVLQCVLEMLDNATRLLIAEDQTLMAEGLRRLLESAFRWVEIAGSGSDLLTTIETFKPDVVLLSVEMNAVQATRRLGRVSRAKLILLTAQDEPEYIAQAFRAGAAGYILKRCTFSELVKAIREVMNGQSYLTPLVPRNVAGTAPELGPQPDSRPLTCRQREVLQLVAEGCTAKEIAKSLNLSVKTAVFHRMAIRDKLGLRTTAALTRYAIENGMGTR
jgi:DNA-binding NarL/FixJ family response regulator